MPVVKSPRPLRELLYSHLTASYGAALVAAAILVDFQSTKFIEMAFPVFLAPILLPFVLLIESQEGAYAAGVSYLTIFSTTWLLLRYRQKRFEREKLAKLSAAAVEPPIDLQYFGSVPLPPKPRSKIIWVAWIALAFGFATVAAEGILIHREGSVNAHDVPWLHAFGPIAVILGLIGCFRTKPHTYSRGAAFAALCIGLLVGGIMVFFECMHWAGLDWD